MDHDAVGKRGAERQDFMKILEREIWEENTPRDLDHTLPLIALILERFEKEDGTKVADTTKARIKALFDDRLMPGIEEFANNPEERLKMLADLLIYLAETTARKYRSAYSMKESEIFS